VSQQKSVAEFNQILFATDFGAESVAAASYAISLAQEHQARLSLLHVVDRSKTDPSLSPTADTEFNSEVRRLQELVPPAAGLWCRPEYFIESGAPAERILQFTAAHDVDLIVMGLHPALGALSVVTHFAHTTAQQIVAHATAPVLTVRG
jgi:nucleotide-binding universal stress UspA family protein